MAFTGRVHYGRKPTRLTHSGNRGRRQHALTRSTSPSGCSSGLARMGGYHPSRQQEDYAPDRQRCAPVRSAAAKVWSLNGSKQTPSQPVLPQRTFVAPGMVSGAPKWLGALNLRVRRTVLMMSGCARRSIPTCVLTFFGPPRNSDVLLERPTNGRPIGASLSMALT